MLSNETFDCDADFKYSSATYAVTGIIFDYSGVSINFSVYSYRYKIYHSLVLIVAIVLETGTRGVFH